MARALTPAEQRAVDAIWTQVRELTRFHHSMRIAARREIAVWSAISTDTAKSSVEIESRPNNTQARYRVSLDDHLSSLGTPVILNGLVLVQSWSLAESLARIALQVDDLPKVEAWSRQLLKANQQSVAHVHGGPGGLVESFVVRNAVAHGLDRWSQRMISRVAAENGPKHYRGQRFDLSDQAVQEYWSGIRSLMRLSGHRPTR